MEERDGSDSLLVRANKLTLQSWRSLFVCFSSQTPLVFRATPANHCYSLITINTPWLWVHLKSAVMEGYFLFDRYHFKVWSYQVIKNGTGDIFLDCYYLSISQTCAGRAPSQMGNILYYYMVGSSDEGLPAQLDLLGMFYNKEGLFHIS